MDLEVRSDRQRRKTGEGERLLRGWYRTRRRGRMDFSRGPTLRQQKEAEEPEKKLERWRTRRFRSQKLQGEASGIDALTEPSAENRQMLDKTDTSFKMLY